MGTRISAATARAWSTFIALIVICIRLKDTTYEPQRLVELADVTITEEEIRDAAGHMLACIFQSGRHIRQWLVPRDEEDILSKLQKNSCIPLVPPPFDSTFKEGKSTTGTYSKEAKLEKKEWKKQQKEARKLANLP